MRVRVVLVRPRYAGNVGSVVRVAANFSVDEVVLVSPACDVEDLEFVRMAMGGGSVVPLRELPDLGTAVADADLVVATTSLRDRDPRGVVTPAQLRQRLTDVGPDTVALVFGSERGGLSREELRLAHFSVCVPTNPAFPVLNLAQAAAVLVAAIRDGSFETREVSEPLDRTAPFGEFEAACGHFERTLLASGYLDPNNPRRVSDQFRRWLGRAVPTSREVALLHALAAHVDYLVGRAEVRQGGTAAAAASDPGDERGRGGGR